MGFLDTFLELTTGNRFNIEEESEIVVSIYA